MILSEHKDADVELEEEVQPVLREDLRSQPGNALTLRNRPQLYKYCRGRDKSHGLGLVLVRTGGLLFAQNILVSSFLIFK